MIFFTIAIFFYNNNIYLFFKISFILNEIRILNKFNIFYKFLQIQ